MSEDFTESNTKLTNSIDEINNFYPILNNSEESDNQLNLQYDHMYTTTNNENNLNLTDITFQTAENEVKFLKDWLILHLDLIQQQNDEILSKERTILILQQENEMLKERINCMERGAPFEPNKFYENHIEDNLEENMTKSVDTCEEDNKNCIELLGLNCDNVVDNTPSKLVNYEQNHNLSDSEVQTDNNFTVEDIDLNKSSPLKSENEVLVDCNNTKSGEFDFTVSSSVEFDPMKNLRMNIRRKRVCSNSSALSSSEQQQVQEEKRSFRRIRKKRKRVLKDNQILTTKDEYITQFGDSNLGLLHSSDPSLDILPNTNLEVPRWRVKIYASCYTMEGTENLDDEVYNKRHSRLEIDERRRKRWDVQRIREQRVIEKLKQRQDRTSLATKTDESNERVQSLWPKIDDIKYLEISDQLPVSAFGCPLPNITPSEFTLPWINNSSLLNSKKGSSRRSTVKKKNSKR